MRIATQVYTQKICTAGMEVMVPTPNESASVVIVMNIEIAASLMHSPMRLSTG